MHPADEDLELVEKAKLGNVEAFRLLFDRYQRKVFMICYGMVRHREDALDLVQETFIKTYRSLSSFKGESQFYTWVYRIAANTCLDFLRKRKRQAKGEPLAEELGADQETGEQLGTVIASPDSPAETLVRKELKEKIERAIDSLPPEHRMVVMLREVEKLSYEEIAKTLGLAIGTVMSRLHYARKKLQEKLK